MSESTDNQYRCPVTVEGMKELFKTLRFNNELGDFIIKHANYALLLATYLHSANRIRYAFGLIAEENIKLLSKEKVALVYLVSTFNYLARLPECVGYSSNVIWNSIAHAVLEGKNQCRDIILFEAENLSQRTITL